MNKLPMLVFFAFAVLASTGCANRGRASGAQTVPVDRILLLHQQGLSDEQLIGQIELQQLGGLVTSADVDVLRKAQVSDGVVRYLQGRAVAQEQLGTYPYVYARRSPFYSPIYLGGGGHHISAHHHHGHH